MAVLMFEELELQAEAFDAEDVDEYGQYEAQVPQCKPRQYDIRKEPMKQYNDREFKQRYRLPKPQGSKRCPLYWRYRMYKYRGLGLAPCRPQCEASQ